MKYLVDVLMILVDLFLILNLIKTEGDIVIFAGIAEGIGVLLFVFCLLGFGRPELSGPGWAPFGGPFTFYHIEFLTFCGALYLSRKSPVKRIRVVHLIIAAIGLFSSYSSLSKAAFVGIFAVTLYYMFWLFSIRKVKHAIGIGALVISVFTFFYLIQGKIVKARVAEFEGVGAGGFDPGNLLERMLPGISIYDDLRWDALTIDQRNKLINMVELFDLKWFPPYTKENLERLKEFINRVVIQYDASVRVRLILHAWKLFKSDRWFGAGIGNYLVEAINMYTKRVEKYIYPHNILLEIAASTGLLGLTIFSAALLISLAMSQRLLLGDENILYFSGYQIFMLVTAQFSGDAFDFRLFWFITLILISSHQNVLRTFILEKR
jgi:O-antigen ligase